MKNTDMLEWMNDLDAKYLSEASQPEFSVQHRRRRFLPAMIAAAAAVLCLSVGAGAYMKYNQRMVQFRFGTVGEARMAELITPQPVTYSNENVRITVENVLSDGKQALVLTTVESDDPATMENLRQATGLFDYMRPKLYLGGELATRSCGVDSMDSSLELQEAMNECWYTLWLELPDDPSEEALADAVLNMDKEVTEYQGKTYVDGELFDGISIPLDLRQNVDAVQMVSEDGKELTLSAFELYQVGWKADNDEWWNMYITWKNGETQRITYGAMAGSDERYGMPPRTFGGFNIPNDTVIENVTGSYECGGPEDWCGFLDVKNVASFQFGDTIYYPVE